MTILVGTCSWAGRVVEPARKLYRTTKPTSEQMLHYYSGLFSTVEVDATFYALPSKRTGQLWADRSPDGFVFHVKAYSLFTTHRITTRSLPADLRRELPPSGQDRPQLHHYEVPEEIKTDMWRRYRSALEPLQQADKLGFVLLQFPPHFGPTRQNADYLLSCQDQLPGLNIAVEFRNTAWFDGRLRDRTPEFLREHGLAMVCVDMPQGFESSIPPLAEATTDESYVRLHGRNTAAWEQGGASVNNIHDYWYTEGELKEWKVRVQKLAEQCSRVYVMFNTVQGLETAQVFQDMIRESQ